MRHFKLLTIYFMSMAYIYVGLRHFIDPDFFLAIMPNYLTFHLELVYLSGIAEVSLGLMLLSKKTRIAGAIGLIILLILVFPANIHLVQSELSQSLLGVTKSQSIYRLPFQGFLISIAYWHSKNN
ncbi:MAG: DoxX family protein [Flavobacteriaceae bacterium]|nr:DoxX family protein [Cryomorphaceae bacterium]MBL6678055.1 DoxX family protein [Flavobacteriaceae bacterium]